MTEAFDTNKFLNELCSVFDKEANINFCMFPGCNDSPINAHSISNKMVLSHLEEDGHVVAALKSRGLRSLDHCFELIGINQASTFKGMCNHHDNKVWSDLDSKPYMDLSCYRPAGTHMEDANSSEEDNKYYFLLFYRGIMHSTYNALILIKNYITLQYKIFNTNSPGDILDPFVWHIRNALCTVGLKMRVDQLYLNGQWDSVVCRGFRIWPAENTWTYLQLVSLDDIQPLHPASAVFSLLPGVGELLFIAVCLREDAEHLEQYLQRNALLPDNKLFRSSLSKMALQDAENIYISPEFWHSLTDNQRYQIKQFWTYTAIHGACPFYQGEELNLFHPSVGERFNR